MTVSKSIIGNVNREVHDYEFQACKVIEKEKLSDKMNRLIENEIIN